MATSGRRRDPLWLGLGLIAWAGLGWLAVTMFNQSPRAAGFDLELLLQAGRDIAGGRSPYAPSMVAGVPPGSTDLFYSYPPPIGQAMSLVAALPSGVLFPALWLAAAAGIGVAARAIGRALGGEPQRLILPALAVAPLFLPFGVGLLFGNLDVLFPLAYGLMLVAAVSPRTADRAAGGVALGLAAIAKIHPGSMGLWFLGRAIRERLTTGRSPSLLVIGAALATALAVLLASFLGGGAELWRDYVPVAGAASGARLLDPRNVGPAAQLALAVGGGEALVRTLHVPVAILAVGLTLAAAVRVRDTLTSLAIAAAASLVVLPITWYHYPAALIPFGIAAIARSGRLEPAARRRARALVVAAALTATIAIAWLPLLYVAVGLSLAGVASTATARGSEDAPQLAESASPERAAAN